MGAIVGTGEIVGEGDGADVGFAVGLAEGVILGSGDGRDVGDAVGFGDGDGDGAAVVGGAVGAGVEDTSNSTASATSREQADIVSR